MRWLEMIARRFRAPELMERMFARLGLAGRIATDEDAAGVLQRAAVRCMTCGSAEACEKWLDQPAEVETPPPYCRNASLILHLKRETGTLH